MPDHSHLELPVWLSTFVPILQSLVVVVLGYVAKLLRDIRAELTVLDKTSAVTQAQVDALKTRIEERRNDVDARFERIEARMDGYHPSSK